MEVFVAEIKSRYPDRFIVLDAPSVQHSTEARILARYCDHALLLVPFGKAVTDEVLAAVDAVGKEKFAGLVFNN
jgi:Mrp family chromosome partitioning ATPase